MLGIIVAMPEEAQPIIDRLSLEEKEKGFYSNSEVILVLSGIGKCNAQNAAWHLFNLGCERILNIGSAGDCGNHGLGTLVFPNVFYDGDFDLSSLGTYTKDPCGVNNRYVVNGAVMQPVKREDCYSYSQFVTDSRLKGAIVEMEAYAIASACVTTGIPFIAIKAMSDSADENADASFKENVESGKELSVIEKNIDTIVDVINNFDSWYVDIYNMKVEEGLNG